VFQVWLVYGKPGAAPSTFYAVSKLTTMSRPPEEAKPKSSQRNRAIEMIEVPLRLTRMLELSIS
jgi:hypothetical protein